MPKQNPGPRVAKPATIQEPRKNLSISAGITALLSDWQPPASLVHTMRGVMFTEISVCLLKVWERPNPIHPRLAILALSMLIWFGSYLTKLCLWIINFGLHFALLFQLQSLGLRDADKYTQCLVLSILCVHVCMILLRVLELGLLDERHVSNETPELAEYGTSKPAAEEPETAEGSDAPRDESLPSEQTEQEIPEVISDVQQQSNVERPRERAASENNQQPEQEDKNNNNTHKAEPVNNNSTAPASELSKILEGFRSTNLANPTTITPATSRPDSPSSTLGGSFAFNPVNLVQNLMVEDDAPPNTGRSAGSSGSGVTTAPPLRVPRPTHAVHADTQWAKQSAPKSGATRSMTQPIKKPTEIQHTESPRRPILTQDQTRSPKTPVLGVLPRDVWNDKPASESPGSSPGKTSKAYRPSSFADLYLKLYRNGPATPPGSPMRSPSLPQPPPVMLPPSVASATAALRCDSPIRSGSGTGSPAPPSPSNNPADPKVYRYCAVCDALCTSRINYDEHVNGAKHALNVEAKAKVEALGLSPQPASDGTSKFVCQECQVPCNGYQQYYDHIMGNAHYYRVGKCMACGLRHPTRRCPEIGVCFRCGSASHKMKDCPGMTPSVGAALRRKTLSNASPLRDRVLIGVGVPPRAGPGTPPLQPQRSPVLIPRNANPQPTTPLLD